MHSVEKFIHAAEASEKPEVRQAASSLQVFYREWVQKTLEKFQTDFSALEQYLKGARAGGRQILEEVRRRLADFSAEYRNFHYDFRLNPNASVMEYSYMASDRSWEVKVTRAPIGFEMQFFQRS